MLINRIICCLFFLLSALPAESNDLINTEITHFPVPDHGEIVFHVPVRWDYTYRSTGIISPPVVTFFRKDKSGEEVFQLNASIFWNDGFQKNILSDENVKTLVQDVGEGLLPFSDETDLELIPLNGKDGQGYFFRLTDSAARPGEYRYLTQGALGVGELLLVFSLFTNEESDQIHNLAIEMVQNASHEIQRYVLFPRIPVKVSARHEEPAV